MKTTLTGVTAALLVCAVMIPETLVAQIGQTALPALSFTTSPHGNGMGGIAATLPSPDAAATMANPGQLGFFSLENLFSASTYAPKTDWYPGLNLLLPGSTRSITASALNAGVNLGDVLSLPFSAGVGVGYSRVFMDWGEFLITGPGGPVVIGRASMNDTYENFSVGIGLEYIARLGIGMNFKKITSRMPGLSERMTPAELTATPSATDFGMLLDIPFAAVVSRFSGEPLRLANGIAPFVDISLSYVKSNVGDEVWYVDPSQKDPLPRTALLGMGLQCGLSEKVGNADWKMLSFSLVHQAEDLLVSRNIDGTFGYQGGVGDLRIGDNLLVGRVTGNVTVRKGWELGAAELIYIRGGSVVSPDFDFSTTGYSICLGGMVRLLESVSQSLAESPWLAFIGDHIDLQYHSATYNAAAASISSLIDGTSFRELNLVVHGIPW